MNSVRLNNFTALHGDMATTDTMHLHGGLVVGNGHVPNITPTCSRQVPSERGQKYPGPLRAYLDQVLSFFQPSSGLAPTSSTPEVATHRDPKLIKSTESWHLFTTTRAPIVAVKISSDKTALKKEHDMHHMVESDMLDLAHAFAKDILLPYVPHCHNYYPNLSASELGDMFTGQDAALSGCAAYTIEYVRPFHQHHLNYLVKRHLSPRIQAKALAETPKAHFIADICLGDVRPLCDKWQDGLNTRRIYVDQLYHEKVDVTAMSASMGSTLAVLHWRCGIDGAGVKFVLGCERKGHIQMWLMSFADCRPFQRTEHGVTMQLVDAVMRSDSCWPRWINLRRFRNLWCSFREAYLATSGRVYSCRHDEHLPSVFINRLESIRGPPASV
jgi:hypothetical protein